MSYKRAIAHNTIIQIIGKIFSTFLGLLAIGMMTRYLGPEKFGWYITANSFLMFIGILIDFGLIPVTAQMLGAAAANQKNTILSNLLGFRFTTACFFLFLAPQIVWFFPYNTEIKIAVALTAIAFLGVAMNQILIGFYQSQLKMHIQVLGELAGRIALIIGLWLLITKGSGFLPIMAITALGSVVYTVVLWIWLARFAPARLGFDFSIWRQIITKSWPIAISIVFNVVYLKGDTILLSLFRGQVEVGLYGAAYRVIDILTQTAMLMMGVILPLLAASWAQKKYADFQHQYQLAFNALLSFAIPVVVGVAILAEPIMTLVAGTNFSASGYPLRILSLAVFGVYLGAIFGHLAVAINRQKETMWIYISNAIITLIGYLIFIPRYGMFGGAGMTVFSELYAGILLFFVTRHYHRRKLRVDNLLKIVFSSLIMALVIYPLRHYNVILTTLIGALTYVIALVITGGISKNTLKEIFSVT